jgi:DNA-binding CsgD family transcriptional regulator
MAGARSEHDPSIILARTREKESLALRLRGYSYDAIGEKLGIEGQSARLAVKRAMAKIEAISDEDATELRRVEVERIDAMLKGLWDAAESGDTAAVATVIKLQERKAKMLGLDKEKKEDESGGALSLTLNINSQAQPNTTTITIGEDTSITTTKAST